MTAPLITEATRRRAIVLLFGVSFLNYLDRNVIGILVPSIKQDLHLSDTEIGFITGIAFSLFYAVMGLPIGRIADRVSRRKVIAVAMTLWSAMTAACGLAMNFGQLALARVLVGVGEAGATPPSHSLIADLFPKERRAAALSMYGIGSAVGLVVGYLAAGWITQTVGWRAALFIVGLPGLLVAVLIWTLLPDPPRGHADGHAPAPQPPLIVTLRTMLTRPTFVHNAIASGLYAGLYFGLLGWVPSFFSRTYQMPIGQIGTYLSLTLGVSQLLGTLTGGFLGDRLAARDRRWLMWLCGLVTVGAVPFYIFVFLAPSQTVAFIVLAIPFFLGVMQTGPQHATTQGVSPPEMRATASALYFMIVSLIAGFGGLGIGVLSDAMTQRFGADALGRAIIIITVGGSLWSGAHFWLAAKHLRRDFGRPA